MTNQPCDHTAFVCPALLGTVLDMCSDGIAIVQNDYILYANLAFGKTNGLSSGSELRGSLLKDLIPRPNNSGRSRFTFERGQDLIEVSSSPFTDNQQAFQIICLCRTLQSKHRDLHLESQGMPFTSQSWVRFAHDFNNLLTSIILCSDLLVWELEPECGLRGHAETIQNAGLTGAKLIREITVQSSQKHPVALVSWNQITSKMMNTIRDLVGPKIQIKTELTEPMGPLRINPTNVHRIILGLVLNAQKAMLRGGVITISTRRCTAITDFVTKQNVCKSRTEFVVTDNGGGIPEKTLTQIRDGSLKRTPGVISVPGLEIIKKIVKRAGGELEIESRLGVGTKVSIRAPATPPLNLGLLKKLNNHKVYVGIRGSVREQKAGHND